MCTCLCKMALFAFSETTWHAMGCTPWHANLLHVCMCWKCVCTRTQTWAMSSCAVPNWSWVDMNIPFGSSIDTGNLTQVRVSDSREVAVLRSGVACLLETRDQQAPTGCKGSPSVLEPTSWPQDEPVWPMCSKGLPSFFAKKGEKLTPWVESKTMFLRKSSWPLSLAHVVCGLWDACVAHLKSAFFCDWGKCCSCQPPGWRVAHFDKACWSSIHHHEEKTMKSVQKQVVFCSPQLFHTEMIVCLHSWRASDHVDWHRERARCIFCGTKAQFCHLFQGKELWWETRDLNSQGKKVTFFVSVSVQIWSFVVLTQTFALSISTPWTHLVSSSVCRCWRCWDLCNWWQHCMCFSLALCSRFAISIEAGLVQKSRPSLGHKD